MAIPVEIYVVGGAVVVIIVLAFAWSRSAKNEGYSKAEREAIKEGEDARERQGKAERDHATRGDLADDADILRRHTERKT